MLSLLRNRITCSAARRFERRRLDADPFAQHCFVASATEIVASAGGGRIRQTGGDPARMYISELSMLVKVTSWNII